MAEPQLAHKYDGATIKQTLDDLAVAVAGETLKENNTYLIVTSVVGAISIAIACYGQFGVAFPQQTNLLIALVALNLILTAAIQLYERFAGGSALFESVATKSSPKPIIVSSHMDRFSMDYQFTVSFKQDPSKKQTWTKSAAQWIRQDGSVDKSGFETLIRQTLSTLQSNKSN